jgi:tRNA dimethylallyltransferase
MGPTASGKTEFAIRLRDVFPVEIISVDSALVYRGMNIGTAKPDAAMLALAPHRLIDIRDPEDSYSAGDFVRDALREMRDIRDSGRIPLLVGGTMMYFRSLTKGIARLPAADEGVRAEIDAEASRRGWDQLHADLARVDPISAARINANDSQRIQRALEVFRLSGRTLPEWQEKHAKDVGVPEFDYVKLALINEDRALLHTNIERRLQKMLELGFPKEVAKLMRRPGLSAAAASMRSVGYRQLWGYLAGEMDLETATYKALVATRQLAKRQMTWLRSEPDLDVFDPLEKDCFDAILIALAGRFPQ